jgi:hypothetical protein
MEKKVNVRTYTYAQLDKYDALCLKDKIQCLESFRIHAVTTVGL